MSARRAFLLVLIGSACLTAAVAIAALVAGDLDEGGGRVLLTTGTISLFSVFALSPAGQLERGERQALAGATLGVIALGLALMIATIWTDGDTEWVWKAALVATYFSVALAQVSAVRAAPGEGAGLMFGTAAIVLGLTAATLASVATVAGSDDDTFIRIIGALAILAILANALRAILRRSRRLDLFRFTCHLEDGGAVASEVRSASFGAALGARVAELERGGGRVVRIERVDG